MKKIMNGIIIVFFCTIVSKILSFISEIIIAKYLGTSLYADAYSMISGIHTVVYPVLGVGIWSIFLPEYKKMMILKNNKIVDGFTNRILTLFIFISTLVALIIFVFSSQIIDIVSYGFSPEAKRIASLLLKIYSPYFVFSIVSSVYAAMLQSNGKFFGSQVREIVSYLPIILFGPILFNYLGVYGFAISLVIGGVLRLLIQFPFVNWGYKFKIDFDFKNSDVIKLLKKMPSVLISSGTDQIHTLVDKIMSSSLAVGSVSSLNYGSKLINVVNGLFTNSIATVLYPKIAELVGKNDLDEVNSLLKTILIIISMLIVPFMFIGILYSKSIVSLVYERGNFDYQSVLSTSSVFIGYLIGIYFIGIKSLIDKFLYALSKNNFVMKLSIFNITLNIILNIIFMTFFGLSGLAYATSISSIIYVMISLFYIHKSINFDCIDYIKKLLIILFSNLVVIILIYYYLNNITNILIVNIFVISIISMIIICIFYYVIKISEFNFIIDYLKKIRVKNNTL